MKTLKKIRKEQSTILEKIRVNNLEIGKKQTLIELFNLSPLNQTKYINLNKNVRKLIAETNALDDVITLIIRRRKIFDIADKTNEQNAKKKLPNQVTYMELKHYPSSVREWDNSIYSYCKNKLDLIPFATLYVKKIIKSFFDMYNNSLEKKIRTKRLLKRLRRLSSNRIYLSNGEFKHTNNNVLINLYIFNRQKYNYIYKLKDMYLKNLLTRKNMNNNIINILKSIYIKSLDSIKEINENKYSLIKALSIMENNNNYKINTFKSLSTYIRHFYKDVLDLTMKKIQLYFLYRQLIYINKSKLNYTYLGLLKKHLENLYNKNVEFNLINIKRFYLNSDILSESVKLKITRNKNNMRNILNRLKDKIKIERKKQFLGAKAFSKHNLNEINNPIILNKFVFNQLKYKHITGFRLEAKGRLSKRFTASRSVYKLKYKGNLLNLDSSYRGLSSVILKGNLKSNIQYSKLNSKTRIGSFGLKGWISSN